MEDNIKIRTLPREWIYDSFHPQEKILRDPLVVIRTRNHIRNELIHTTFISIIELTSVEEVIKVEFLVEAM